MTAISPTTRRRLEIQGFVGINERWLAETAPWLRLSPALCTLLMALGTALASPATLWALAIIAALGSIFPVHPFDLLYNHGIRHLVGKPRLPHNGAPRRFACLLATLWLAGTAFAFQGGSMVTGYTLGAAITAVALLVTATNICIPSLLYGGLFGFPAAVLGAHHTPSPLAASSRNDAGTFAPGIASSTVNSNRTDGSYRHRRMQ
jgi:hypothetical protein